MPWLINEHQAIYTEQILCFHEDYLYKRLDFDDFLMSTV
jgi:hypothetical protein